LQSSVVEWLQSQAVEFYDCGIQKLVKTLWQVSQCGWKLCRKIVKGCSFKL
jgi:hypothetical protein